MPGVVLFLAFAVLASIVFDAAAIRRAPRRIEGRHRRTPFGWAIKAIVGNPVMPLVSIGAVIAFVVATFAYFAENNNGVEFFVDSEPEQAIVYVRARGNLSLTEKDALVRRAEAIVLANPGVQSAFAFAGEGGLDANTGGAQAPKDTIGQIQLETIAWDDRAAYAATHDLPLGRLDGDVVVDDLSARLSRIPGIEVEILAQAQGPASGKPIHLRLKGDDRDTLLAATAQARQRFEATPGLTLVEDTRPLPGIDWQIDVDVEQAGRFGADVASVGAMVQLVTRGVLLDSYTPANSDEEIEIRVRLPEQDRLLSTLDTLRVRTDDGLIPLANFITRTPVAKLDEINRIDQKRYFDVKADVVGGIEILQMTPLDEDGAEVEDGSIDVGFGYAVSKEDFAAGEPANVSLTENIGWFTSLFREARVFRYNVPRVAQSVDLDLVQAELDRGTATVNLVPMTSNERIGKLTTWLETQPLPAGIDWEWTGDQEEQAESQAFLLSAFVAALGLMFIILLAQFNSVYNAVLVLLAVVLSTTGVLIGMLVMDQYFSIIMTGTGIVALAGIVVNNNIVLIDTYQEYARYMPRIEAIVRTAEDRIRPVLLTTITTMAGLAPMMFGLSLDFFGGGYSIDSPTALWWKNLATAVVFGLGVATVLTLIFTPSMLALRVWFWTYVRAFAQLLARLSLGRSSRMARDWALEREARRIRTVEIIWTEDDATDAPAAALRAAE